MTEWAWWRDAGSKPRAVRLPPDPARRPPTGRRGRLLLSAGGRQRSVGERNQKSF